MMAVMGTTHTAIQHFIGARIECGHVLVTVCVVNGYMYAELAVRVYEDGHREIETCAMLDERCRPLPLSARPAWCEHWADHASELHYVADGEWAAERLQGGY